LGDHVVGRTKLTSLDLHHDALTEAGVAKLAALT